MWPLIWAIGRTAPEWLGPTLLAGGVGSAAWVAGTWRR